MKRHESLIEFSREHHEALILAQILKKNHPGYAGLPQTPEEKLSHTIREFDGKIFPHFELEEKFLLPQIRGRSAALDRLCDEILAEHKILREKISLLRKNINAEKNLQEFGELLDRHIRKEERELFRLIQENFSEEELKEKNFREL